jgi:hypothetical protein
MMAMHEASLSEDLSILAAEDRHRLGEPPTAEQLIALRDGTLPAEEAERLRDRLVVDPEWMSIYQELKRPLVPGDADEAGEIDLDGAWNRLSRTMEIPSIEGHKRKLVEPGAVPAREVVRRFLPLAAGLLLGLGLVWSLVNRDLGSPPGNYLVVVVTGEGLRSSGTTLHMPKNSAGLEFQIDVSDFPPKADIVVELKDFEGSAIFHQQAAKEPGQTLLRFRIPAEKLKDEWVYKLTASSSGVGAKSLTEVFTVDIQP